MMPFLTRLSSLHPALLRHLFERFFAEGDQTKYGLILR
jgi:hypothetical protein